MKTSFTKKLIFLSLSLILFFASKSQIVQTSIGSAGVTEFFYDTKFDPNDGGTINVGYIDKEIGNSNDLYLVKLNSLHQIVWQKIIPNAGDDAFYKVIVCADGNYIATGQIYQNGVRSGVVCKIKNTDGTLIWSKVSANPSAGGFFYDVIETVNGNIALAGTDNFATSVTNAFVVLLNSDGETIWSKVTSTNLADEFRNIAQLPNGDLLLVGFYNPNGVNYYGTILELDEMTGTINNQNTYNINTTIPGGLFTLNSLWSVSIYVKNSTVIINFFTFQGFGTPGQECILTYDQTTKELTGNIYYHPDAGTLTGITFYPLTENDFITALTSSSTNEAYVSRITDGVVVFDRKINNNAISITSMNVSNTNVEFAGDIINSDADAYNFFSSVDIPTSTSPCNISDNNTLALQAVSLPATEQTVQILSPASQLIDLSVNIQDLSNSANDVCSSVVPVTLVDFRATYKSNDESVSLQWSTSSEINSKQFIIERSTDAGKTFSEIGSVKAAGKSSTLLQYNLNDLSPATGENYYRLKQIDIDNKFKFSDIKSIVCNRLAKVFYILSPVPAHVFTFLKITGAIGKLITVDIFDATSKLVGHSINHIDNNNPLKLDISLFKKGIYFIKISSEGNKSVTKKLIVE